MLFIINCTGLKKFYWLPKLKYQKDKELWYIELSFLFCQAMIYSKSMGAHLINLINEKVDDENT